MKMNSVTDWDFIEKIAEEHNNKLRRENEHEEKRKDSNRKGFERVKNGYTCPIGRFMRHLDPIEINHRKPHEDDNLPDICKKKRHIFKTYSCKGCPRSENCIKIIEDRISDLIFDMTNKFLDKRHNIHYKSRFSRSECHFLCLSQWECSSKRKYGVTADMAF